MRRWWADAVFYQVYPRSFADSNGDGVGDLDGVSAGLDHLAALGVDALWLNPVMVSPMADHGYDVADPRDVDPLFGGIDALDRLLDAAHARGIRVTMDLVPNHTSSAHPWFVQALADPSLRDRYIFRDGRGPRGYAPPNNWVSVFGGPAWTRVTEPDGTPGQWYLHLFDPAQPDLNWNHPEVFEDLEKTLRFWLDRGVDGFRIDVAHGMAKPPELPDMAVTDTALLRNSDDDPRFDNDSVHDIHRFIRTVLDDYPDAVAVGEVWVHGNERFAKYLRPDELHLGFNFRLVQADFDASEVHDAIDNAIAAANLAGATPTWTLSNHDVEREVTRYGGGPRGVARARAMALVMLALPGAVFVYNGEELGLPNVDLPDEVLQDPVWERSGHTERGRDGCRVPMPWSGDIPPFGFSSSADTWLPMPADWASLTVQRQQADPASTLEFYRRAIRLRSGRAEFTGSRIELYTAGEVLTLRREGGLMCVLNTGAGPAPLPPGDVLLSSGELTAGLLPADTAAWLIQQ
ncbi:glycoside hydrolase family 13 protein [Mycobacterium sp. 48b]|uniref:glycoside hydrolase family 13 protein n=1 Tax=Mycobacterium sp. 48b TaxID=3400426 RepID=UPI003AAC11B1